MRPSELPHTCTITPVATVSGKPKMGTDSQPVYSDTTITVPCRYLNRSSLSFKDISITPGISGRLVCVAGKAPETVLETDGTETRIWRGSKVTNITDKHSGTVIYKGTLQTGDIEHGTDMTGKPVDISIALIGARS